VRKKHTEEHIQYIADNIKGRSHKEMAIMFNEHFGTDFPASTILSLTFRNGLKNGRDCRILAGELAAGAGKEYRFKKGNTAWNKGMKGLKMGGEATQFKRGNRPHTYKPVGTETVNTDGYVVVKIADPGKWRQKHILIWDAVNGPIPKGHCLIFADSNPLNVVMENLILITRAELAVMNKRGLIAKSVELTRAGIAVADIIMKVTDIKKKGRKTP